MLLKLAYYWGYLQTAHNQLLGDIPGILRYYTTGEATYVYVDHIETVYRVPTTLFGLPTKVFLEHNTYRGVKLTLLRESPLTKFDRFKFWCIDHISKLASYLAERPRVKIY